MDTLLHRFGSLIKGCIEGFDRIIFKGSLRPIAYAVGMQSYLRSKGILNKDFKGWAMEKSAIIVEAAEQYTQRECGKDIIYIPSINTRKEGLAHKSQKESGIENGLIGAWSCVEGCKTYKSTFNHAAQYPILQPINSRCKHLYFYYDHQDYGFMSVRLQTWAPYGIQIAVNGREWLRRSLEKAECGYVIDGNKFLHIDDYGLAQQLLDKQRETNWEQLLTGFAKEAFPSMQDMFGENMGYYWTVWQSEVARDYIFKDPQSFEPLADRIVRHAIMAGKYENVLRYLDHPVKKDGQPYRNANIDLLSKVNTWGDGMRVRHYVDGNSVKVYNQHNVLRFETTVNNPGKYKIHRLPQNAGESDGKKFLPMRKGIADINVRATISSERNSAFVEQLATVSDKTPFAETIKDVTRPVAGINKKKVRALNITGKDRELLRAVSDPAFNAGSITNKALQKALVGTDWANGMTDKKLSAKISRQLSLLRSHGIIKKLPKQHRYMLTDKGRKITLALNAMLSASTEDFVNATA